MAYVPTLVMLRLVNHTISGTSYSCIALQTIAVDSELPAMLGR